MLITRNKKLLSFVTSAAMALTITMSVIPVSALDAVNKPFDVVATINGDTKTQMGLTWFTNPGSANSVLQVIEGNNKTASDFTGGVLKEYTDTKSALNNIAYDTNVTKSYEDHKALATGLKPNTTYSYRVGNDTDGWSEIGTFTTAMQENSSFNFIYLTDTQAQNTSQFGISKNTIHQAITKVPSAKFILEPGDLIETSTTGGREWEWEQYFSTNQDVFYNIPFAPAIGNHDNNNNWNFSNHFNTASLPSGMTAAKPGTVYSFEYGNALFMVLNYEVYNSSSDLDAMANWMKSVASSSNKKWKIAVFHKAMYTGSGSHQSDSDAKIIRGKFAPLFDELHIDMAIQGHDHIYEVIGPVKNSKLVSGEVSGVTSDTAIDPKGNGKKGGTFDVTQGTLYFLNGAAGSKFYYPRSESEMNAAQSSTRY
ncbi:MAG: fibronectin type III domain-containing protein [Bacillota bacterium]|nr:fibronectin type III domain-containing protein [Bacillota bacterium]